MSVTIGRPIFMLPISERGNPEPVGFSPLPLPEGWTHRADMLPHWLAFRSRDGLAALISARRESDGQDWLHVSISRFDRLPSYEDLCRVKRDWVGRFRKAVQIFPPEDQHVNVCPNALHLFACLTADKLPDFRYEDGTI